MRKGLNIGAGPVHLDSSSFCDWENSDFADTEPAKGWSLEKLRDFTKPMTDIEDDTIDFIVAWHIIEHVGLHEKDAIITEWKRVLRPGGMLFIACPDIVKIAQNIVRATPPWNDPFIRAVNIYGPYNGYVGDYHKWGYDQETLKGILQTLGFSNVFDLDPQRLAQFIGADNALKMGFADYNVQIGAIK